MDGAAGEEGAFAETVIFLSYFKDLPDNRQQAKVMYPLAEVLLLCLLAVLAGAETITDIARFGEKKLELLRRFRSFAAGTPAHDHLGDILDPEAFQRRFVAWVAALIGVPEGVVAIDGKTVRRLPGFPQYWRATPTECIPFFGKPVSSMSQAVIGPPRSIIRGTV